MTVITADPPAVDANASEPAVASPGLIGAAIVAAFEHAWRAIQARNMDVPDVVMIMGSGVKPRSALKFGHFHANCWHGRTPTEADQDAVSPLPEVFIGGEGLAREAADVLGTLLHEAAHGIAFVREIKDTSREGRWHNKKFKKLAEEVGIAVEKDKRIGYSVTAVPAATATDYADVIEVLAAALARYRDSAGSGRTRAKAAPPLECGCGRKIRVARTVLALGPILCGTCDEQFQPPDDDEEEN